MVYTLKLAEAHKAIVFVHVAVALGVSVEDQPDGVGLRFPLWVS